VSAGAEADSTLIREIGAPPSTQEASTRPKPLNVTQLDATAGLAASTALTLTPVLPSLPARDWTSRGATVSDAASAHLLTGLSMLTTHDAPALVRAQVPVMPLTSHKETRAFRRRASLRASANPACMLSAVLRIPVLRMNVWNPGIATASNIAMIATAIIISTRVNPRLRFMM
jgi:hypothetical protein